ncbi:MAG: CmcI family methyltransferase [Gammaproteobacteria bacterium]
MIQGSSISPAVIDQVRALAANYSYMLACLDSNHTHEHALAESEACAPLTLMGSYCLASQYPFYGALCHCVEHAKGQ